MVAVPGDGAYAIEKAPSPHITGGQFFQVVGIGNIVCRQFLGLHGTAIAINLHLRQTGESGTANQVFI